MCEELPELPYYCAIPNHQISYHHGDDAGIDLPIWDDALTNGEISTGGHVFLKPGESVTLKTGIYMAIPKKHYGLLDSRSGTSKMKLDLLCRIIDSPFRGNIRVAIINLGDEEVKISNKDEPFQIVIQEYTKLKPVKLDSEEAFLQYAGRTERGADGFGSKERNKKEEN